MDVPLVNLHNNFFDDNFPKVNTKFSLYVRPMCARLGTIPEQSDFSLNDIESQLQPETPVAQRCKALREISDIVRRTPLEDV